MQNEFGVKEEIATENISSTVSSETVSYTHLDVYKRQGVSCEWPQRIGPSNCLAKTQVYAKPKGEVYGLTPAPVSYTHLDVYKRHLFLR